MTKQSSLTAVSLFSGCGGFDLGAQGAGIRIVMANDIDPAAAAVYRTLLPQTDFIEGDISSVKEFPKADVLIGCYPCTGFSLGGRRRWHRRKRPRDLRADDGNYLYREFLRALRAVAPKYFFVENVRGLVSADDGWFFTRQVANFRRLGYRVTWKLLMASDYGVPQTRRRLFIVGVRRGEATMDYQFPATAVTAASTLRDALWDSSRWPRGDYFDYPFHGHYLTRNRKRGWDEPSFTIVADAHHVPLHPMGRPMVFVKKDTWRLQGKSNRRLSWRECAMIQGLPGDAFEVIRAARGAIDDGYQAMRMRYRAVGNAVPPQLARSLVEPVVGFERTMKSSDRKSPARRG